MIYSRCLQQVVVMVLNGCINSATLPGSASPPPSLQESSPIPTASQPLIILTPTPLITNFEQCVDAGGSMQRTYPRQCISYSGENFEEILPEGIVFSHIYGNKGMGNREDPYFIMSTLVGKNKWDQ